MARAPGAVAAQAAQCELHGLGYDPRVHAGCVVCRRAAASERAAQPAVRKRWWRPLVLGGVLLATLLVAARPLRELLNSPLAVGSVAASARALLNPRPAAGPPLRVLFVGNSYTFKNDLPGLIAGLASAAGERRFVKQQNTIGGWGLREHLAAGQVQQRLDKEHWDVVVLQDQSQRPSFAPQWRKEWFETPARALAAAARKAGARVLLFETFAHRNGNRELATDSYEAMQARLDEAYTGIAAELGLDVVPVGALWGALRHSDPQLNLWAADGMHPNLAGSYLAACAFYAQLFGHSPLGNAFTANLPANQVELLQRTAASFLSAAAGKPLAPPP